MTTGSDDAMADLAAGAGPDDGPAPETGGTSLRETMREVRYRAYERVFAALSPPGLEDDSSLTPTERSYRQHAVIETLRDLELSRRRYLLLHPEEAGEPEAAAGAP